MRDFAKVHISTIRFTYPKYTYYKVRNPRIFSRVEGPHRAYLPHYRSLQEYRTPCHSSSSFPEYIALVVLL